jgi:hypothetical protein
MPMPIKLILQEIINNYQLMPLVHRVYVYVDINKEMHGLLRAGLLANKLVLACRITKYGYFQAEHTPGLWKHTCCPVQFELVVDGFGVEYESKTHAQLLDALNNHY